MVLLVGNGLLFIDWKYVMLVLCYYWVLCNWMCRKVVICLCCCGFMLCGGGVVFCVLVLGVLGFRVV